LSPKYHHLIVSIAWIKEFLKSHVMIAQNLHRIKSCNDDAMQRLYGRRKKLEKRKIIYVIIQKKKKGKKNQTLFLEQAHFYIFHKGQDYHKRSNKIIYLMPQSIQFTFL
jgi:hypothetical protein